MNKKDLIQYVSEVAGVKKTDATKTIDAVFQGIEGSLLNKEECQFLGFGAFKIRKRSARTGRNPRTGETLKIKESFSVGFIPSKNLKEGLNK